VAVEAAVSVAKRRARARNSRCLCCLCFSFWLSVKGDPLSRLSEYTNASSSAVAEVADAAAVGLVGEGKEAVRLLRLAVGLPLPPPPPLPLPLPLPLILADRLVAERASDDESKDMLAPLIPKLPRHALFDARSAGFPSIWVPSLVARGWSCFRTGSSDHRELFPPRWPTCRLP